MYLPISARILFEVSLLPVIASIINTIAVLVANLSTVFARFNLQKELRNISSRSDWLIPDFQPSKYASKEVTQLRLIIEEARTRNSLR